jgi:hypothetical protein
MTSPFLSVLLPIELLLVTITVFFVYVFLRTPHTFRIKFIGVPVLLFGAFYALLNLDGMLGRPYPGVPSSEFTFINYRVALDKENKKWIELWVLDKKSSRLFVFPYTKEAEKQLRPAQAKTQKGIAQKGKFKKKTNGVKSDATILELYDIPTNVLPPKEVGPEQVPPRAPAAMPDVPIPAPAYPSPAPTPPQGDHSMEGP